jgi:hypothetical protein
MTHGVWRKTCEFSFPQTNSEVLREMQFKDGRICAVAVEDAVMFHKMAQWQVTKLLHCMYGSPFRDHTFIAVSNPGDVPSTWNLLLSGAISGYYRDEGWCVNPLHWSKLRSRWRRSEQSFFYQYVLSVTWVLRHIEVDMWSVVKAIPVTGCGGP